MCISPQNRTLPRRSKNYFSRTALILTPMGPDPAIGQRNDRVGMQRNTIWSGADGRLGGRP